MLIEKFNQDLRKKSEEIAKQKFIQSSENKMKFCTIADQDLIYELEVHQIELDMQNEQLRNKFGLIVDSVYRQEEIVVKSLPESLANVNGLAGASLLGDGKVILILDSIQLYNSVIKNKINK